MPRAKETTRQYLVSSLGVSLLVTPQDNIQWFIDLAVGKGGIVTIERVPEAV